MAEIHGVRAVIYDIADKPYFLIAHDTELNSWRFIEGERDPGEDTQAAVEREVKARTNLKSTEQTPLKVAVPVNGSNQEVFLVRCNMNSHIVMDKRYDTYLWCSQDSVEKKIPNGANRELFERALSILKRQ